MILADQFVQDSLVIPGSMSAVNQAFPRQSRLLKPAEFKHVFDRPVVSSDHLFKVFARTGSSQQFRLGIAVSKKVDRRAVVRNRIKRHVRESFRMDLAPGGAGQDTAVVCIADFVVVASPGSGKATGKELRQSLVRHWRRIDHKLGKLKASQKTQ